VSVGAHVTYPRVTVGSSNGRLGGAVSTEGRYCCWTPAALVREDVDGLPGEAAAERYVERARRYEDGADVLEDSTQGHTSSGAGDQ